MTTPPDDRWSVLATRILAPNPGPMTLEGTNTFVIRRPGAARAVLVDPGPSIASHQEALQEVGPIELILLTHHHLDHTESAVDLARRTGAPVRAWDAALCVDALPLRDGEDIVAAGTRIVVRATPGHTSDSVCFHLPDDGLTEGSATGTLLTGDTILGRGSTVVIDPDGSIAQYLDTMQLIGRLGSIPALPGHGPVLADVSATARIQRMHRVERLAQVRAVLADLGRPPSLDDEIVAAVSGAIYPHTPEALQPATRTITAAQLRYLAETAETAAVS